MIEKQALEMLENKWKTDEYYKPMSVISKSSDERGSLVPSDGKAFSFDEICGNLFKKNTPKTADAIFQHNKTIIVAEMKTGFRDELDLEKDRKKIGNCTFLKEKGQEHFCDKYYDLFRRYRKKVKEELKVSVYEKALDSYIILANNFIDRKSSRENDKCKIHYVLVIEDKKISAMDNMIATFAEVSKESSVEKIEDNVKISLTKYLAKLKAVNRKIENLYDEVKVLTASEFKEIYNFS